MRNRQPGPARFVSAAVALAAVGCGAQSGPAPATEVRSEKVRVTSPAVAPEDLATVAADNRHFALDLYKAIDGTGDNLVFSPASISIALAMTYGGAAGTTASQMATALHFSLPPERLHPAFDALDLALEAAPAGGDGAFQLSLANALWGQQGFSFLPSFLDLLAESYGAGMHVVDFAHATEGARLTINQWVSSQTAGKIPTLLAPGILDAGTAFVLTNAVYFKADWLSSFRANSQNATFNAPAGPVQVPMMTREGAVTGWSGTGWHAAELPYQGGTTSMVLIVPDAGTFDAFQSALTFDGLEAMLAPAATTFYVFAMPRFKFRTAVGLVPALRSLGMSDAFGGSADFSGIDGARDLSIKDVVHQAMIAVDEKGTEAAAATAVVGERASAAAGELLTVDRPFLFAIRDDATGTILFLGRVLDPSRP
jgi:serpin B